MLAVARLPDRVPGLPTVTPALALSLAWLFVTAFQRPWYDVMAISLLALYSASRLDWVVLIRLLAGATIYVQAIQSPAEPHWLYDLSQFNGTWLTPTIRLLAAVAFVWLCVSGRWGWRSVSRHRPGGSLNCCRRPERRSPQARIVDNSLRNGPGWAVPLAT